MNSSCCINVSLRIRLKHPCEITDLRILVSVITEPDMSLEVRTISRGQLKWGTRFYR
jgi:hypothetical protein